MVHYLGIWAGMRTVRYFDGKTYEWVGISRQPSVFGKVSFFRNSFLFLQMIVVAHFKYDCKS